MKIFNRIIIERGENDPSPKQLAEQCSSQLDRKCPVNGDLLLCPFQEILCSHVTEKDWKRVMKHATNTVPIASMTIKE